MPIKPQQVLYFLLGLMNFTGMLQACLLMGRTLWCFVGLLSSLVSSFFLSLLARAEKVWVVCLEGYGIAE
jgi:hypothetical protein